MHRMHHILKKGWVVFSHVVSEQFAALLECLYHVAKSKSRLFWKRQQLPDLFFFSDTTTFLSLCQSSESLASCVQEDLCAHSDSPSSQWKPPQARSAGFQSTKKGHHFLVTDLPIKVMRQRSAARCDPAASGEVLLNWPLSLRYLSWHSCQSCSARSDLRKTSPPLQPRSCSVTTTDWQVTWSASK